MVRLNFFYLNSSLKFIDIETGILDQQSLYFYCVLLKYRDLEQLHRKIISNIVP